MSDRPDGIDGRKLEHAAFHEVTPQADGDSTPAADEGNNNEADDSAREVDAHEPYTGSDETGA